MIPKYSVKRPYTVLVAVVLVIVLGVVSLTRMTTDLLPAMNLPYVIVVTTDVGASPEEVEKDVTSPIEAAMATTSNINNVSSMSYDNYSMVVLEYEQSTNMDSAMIEIQQQLDQLTGQFPDSVGTPIIMQIDPDMMPVMIASADVDGMDQAEVSDYVDNELLPLFESIEGVASVTATGAGYGPSGNHESGKNRCFKRTDFKQNRCPVYRCTGRVRQGIFPDRQWEKEAFRW